MFTPTVHVPTTIRPNRNASDGLLAACYRSEPAFTIAGLVLLALMLPTGMAAVVDDRLFHGVDIWEKPLKFQFALAVYLMTLAFYARWLPAGMTARPGYRIYAGAVVAAIGAEVSWISGAAALGTASHFNERTPTLYAVMGGLAVFLTSATAVYAIGISLNGANRLSAAARTALGLGLGLVLPLTLVAAGTLAQSGGHWVGGTPDDSLGLVVMGWSRDGGDLRAAHFFATHAMHFVPAFGLVSIWLFGPTRRWAVVAFAALYAIATGLVFMQALAGRPFPLG